MTSKKPVAAVDNPAGDSYVHIKPDGPQLKDPKNEGYGGYQDRDILYAVQILSDLLADDPNIFVGTNTAVYYDPEDRRRCVRPDLCIAFNVDASKISESEGYLLWEIGKAPDLVLEAASLSTSTIDRGRKRDQFANLGVPEYWQFDKTAGKLDGAELVGGYLLDGMYESFPTKKTDDGILWAYSPILDLNLRSNRLRLELQDPSTEDILLDRRGLRLAMERVQARLRQVEQERETERQQRLTIEMALECERQARAVVENELAQFRHQITDESHLWREDTEPREQHTSWAHKPNETSNLLHLRANDIYRGDARELLRRVTPESVALSFWSPPYWVGKSYESSSSYPQWSDLLKQTIKLHFDVIAPGGFLGINIADILAFEDPNMPRIQADNIGAKKINLTREQILAALEKDPSLDKYRLAELFGCSEQTIERRLKHNNVRGGKSSPQTRVKLTAGLMELWAHDAGFYLYDRRIWVKDPCWENSRWHSLSYRSVDESEYVLIFWKPGITKVDRKRLTQAEWPEWGSRGVWHIPSVRVNDVHEAQYPEELPRRMIKLLTEPGELVLDCFIGSGTTAIAAIGEDRRFMGFDNDATAVSLAKRRVQSALRAKS